MSANKLGAILFSSFLIFATAPLAPAQNTTSQDTTKKQTTTKKGTASKDQSTQTDQSTTTDQSKSTTAKSKSQTTDKATDKGTQSKTGEKKAKKGTTTKKSSMSHEKVRQAQTALKDQGFDPGRIDGIMGPMTMTALRNYQLHNHLQDTGMLDPQTESSLLSGASASTFSSQNQYQSQPNDQRSSLEKPGVTSRGNLTDLEDVRQVQQSLTDLGYMPGDTNGMMSSDTQAAIQQFQWMNNLPVTGNLDQTTTMAIDTQAQGSVSSAQLAQDRQTLTDQEREKPYQDNTYKQDTTSTSRTKPSGQDTYGKDAKHHETGKYDKDASDRATKAAAVLQDLTATSDRRIPDQILQRADAIAVIPHVIKGAFGIGGRFGKGLVSERDEGGRWSPPSFIEIGGGSFGAQLGVQSTDLVLVFTDRKALDKLEKGLDMKLGVDASVAAGPIGRSAEAGTNLNLATAIYSYSRAKGLFAGVALDGAVLNMDKSMNEKVYGSSVDAREILSGNVTPNRSVQPFMDALEKVVPKKRISQR
jgi:lipid-binding SYLF domain-containing protein/peptidoglycan hydrolase-like protein with peptidoglycan-binding domain